MQKPKAWSKAAKDWTKGHGVAWVANFGLGMSYHHTSAMMRGVANTTEKTAKKLVGLSGLTLADFGQKKAGK